MVIGTKPCPLYNFNPVNVHLCSALNYVKDISLDYCFLNSLKLNVAHGTGAHL